MPPHQVGVGRDSDGPRPRRRAAGGHDGRLKQHPREQRASFPKGRLVGLSLQECSCALKIGRKRESACVCTCVRRRWDGAQACWDQ
jgi:hypothetical protein